LLALLKSVIRSECHDPGGSIVLPTVIACIVSVSLAFVATTLNLFISQASALISTVCSKWQAIFFLFLSVQRLAMSVIVIHAVSTGNRHADTCFRLSTEYEYQLYAILFMWNCIVPMMALSTLCCDIHTESSPVLRRCAYCLLALWLLVDAIGSFIWSNPMAREVSLSVGSMSIILDNQITSCIASQVVIALHFVYVSFRSRNGCAWAFAPLRFELDECGKSLSSPRSPQIATQTSSKCGITESASTVILQSKAPSNPSSHPQSSCAILSVFFSRFRRRLFQFQERHVSRCRVFTIPCVAIYDTGGGVYSEFSMARPLFDANWLLPLQRFADAHPICYFGFVFCFFTIPSIFCYLFLKGQEEGISTFVLNSFMVVTGFGFLSSKRYGLDLVAVKHVALSFRFLILTALLGAEVILYSRLAYRNVYHPTQAAAAAVLNTFFCQCTLLDCSPNLPASIQICISVLE
jgi:hypothetical protein